MKEMKKKMKKKGRDRRGKEWRYK
jgi:hypothetical protein